MSMKRVLISVSIFLYRFVLITLAVQNIEKHLEILGTCRVCAKKKDQERHKKNIFSKI